MFCPNCGTEHVNEAAYCKNCGAQLRKPERDGQNGSVGGHKRLRVDEPALQQNEDGTKNNRAASPSAPEADAELGPHSIGNVAHQQLASNQEKPPAQSMAPSPTGNQATQQRQQSKRQGKRIKPLPIILGGAVIVIAGVLGFVMLGGQGTGDGGADEPTQQTSTSASTAISNVAFVSDLKDNKAVADAEKLARELEELHKSTATEGQGSATSSGSSNAANKSTTTKGQGSTSSSGSSNAVDEILDIYKSYLDRIKRDIDDLGDDADDPTVKKARRAMTNIQEMLESGIEFFEAARPVYDMTNAKGATLEDSLDSFKTFEEKLSQMEAPGFISASIEGLKNTFPVVEASIKYQKYDKDSTLYKYAAQETYYWWKKRFLLYGDSLDKAYASQCNATASMLADIREGNMPDEEIAFSIDAISEIAPNLYPRLDSAVSIYATAPDDEQSVTVDAEIVGFSQPFKQKYDLAQGVNHLSIKPAVLPTEQISNLANSKDTQLNITVTSDESGKVLVQKSYPVRMLSIYDFTWENSEYGATSQFDILAWLRPQAVEVSAINRDAAEVLGEWTQGKYKSIAGYQYGDDLYATLLQVAAIQTAISKAGVAYTKDSYSFSADQHVLTPDQVIEQKHGLCIETSLLMASCLMAAGMHPLVITTPNHAQVAVESYEGSGNYFLIETTRLPYEGVDASRSESEPAFWNGLLATYSDGKLCTASGASDEWSNYFNAVGDSSSPFNGVFVIDCGLQKALNIQGLENY